MREQSEQFLSPDPNDQTCSRMIDRRDQSVWPAEDKGYRFQPRKK